MIVFLWCGGRYCRSVDGCGGGMIVCMVTLGDIVGVLIVAVVLVGVFVVVVVPPPTNIMWSSSFTSPHILAHSSFVKPTPSPTE